MSVVLPQQQFAPLRSRSALRYLNNSSLRYGRVLRCALQCCSSKTRNSKSQEQRPKISWDSWDNLDSSKLSHAKVEVTKPHNRPQERTSEKS